MHGDGGALLHRARPLVIVECGRGVARIGSIDLDQRVSHIEGKLDRECVQGRLRGVIGQVLEVGKLKRGVAVEGERPEASALETFVSPTFIRFVDVLVIAALVLIPSETHLTLGLLLLLPALASLWSTVTVLRRSREYEQSVLGSVHWIWNVAAPGVASVLLLITTLLLLLDRVEALNVLAAATLLLLVTALINTWAVMTWLAQQQTTRQ